MMRRSGSVSCLAAGTASGTLGLLVVTNTVEPCWMAQPPQASFDDAGGIARTRMQCARDASGAQRLLLLDLVQLEVKSIYL